MNLEEIIKNTRGTLECLIDFGMNPAMTDLIAIRKGFESIIAEVERLQKATRNRAYWEGIDDLERIIDGAFYHNLTVLTVDGTEYIGLNEARDAIEGLAKELKEERIRK